MRLDSGLSDFLTLSHSICFILVRVAVNPESILGILGVKWGYILDEMPVHHRAVSLTLCSCLTRGNDGLVVYSSVILMEGCEFKSQEEKSAIGRHFSNTPNPQALGLIDSPGLI